LYTNYLLAIIYIHTLFCQELFKIFEISKKIPPSIHWETIDGGERGLVRE